MAFPGNGNSSPQSHLMHRTRYSPGRQTDPLHEQQRRPGKRISACPHGTECRRLIDPSLRQFMQQSGGINQLIFNLKKSMDLCVKSKWKYKSKTIQPAADAFSIILNSDELDCSTFVPIPPSKSWWTAKRRLTLVAGI